MMRNDLLIGLIGGSGCGKSVFSNAAKSLGFTVIDGDKIGHDIILKGKPAYYQLIKAFGEEILDDDLEINRKKLGEIAFKTDENLKLLNSISHPEIIKETLEQINGNTVIDAAVLHKTELIKKCDYVVLITASDNERIKRITKRDNISEDFAMQRIKKQPSLFEYQKFSNVVLENNSDEKSFFEKSIETLERMISS